MLQVIADLIIRDLL